MCEIIKYERIIKSKDDYYNDLFTNCKVYPEIKVGSGYCIAFCKNIINHNKDKNEVECKQDYSIKKWS